MRFGWTDACIVSFSVCYMYHNQLYSQRTDHHGTPSLVRFDPRSLGRRDYQPCGENPPPGSLPPTARIGLYGRKGIS